MTVIGHELNKVDLESMNSILKRKMHKGSISIQKIYDTKARNNQKQ